ncbi:carboxylesterase family protein [uncultured Traorella sp.]|uniref:carboxylesterase/lipase family protein n=1 Tax=uncultured Traorella sp. TaxID=1929048 RepID=UPI0025FB2138|nr:carboxylesterase family protein [uncultured Traorella sp.]
MDSLTIKTNKGLVRGIKEDGVNKFLGIPYAKKPVGDLRFSPPVECDSWQGELEVIKWPANPIQPINESNPFNLNSVSGYSEDCLYLNIFVPDKDIKDTPVMVWFYGGGYTTGGCSFDSYDGSNMAKNNEVIIVTANYRLGLFGFLYMEEINGNNNTNPGLADAIAILKWVKDNISSFGGDKNNVTVFGQSAGSSLINILMISPKAKNLFHAAITQSGSPFNHDEWRLGKNKAQEKTWNYLKKIGINSVEELKNATSERLLIDKDAYAMSEFCPYVDNYYIPDELEKTYLKGVIYPVPVMVGLTKDEATILVSGGDSHGERGSATASRFERTIVRKYDFEEARNFLYGKYGSYLKSDPAYALARFRSDNSLANQMYFAECLNERTKEDVYFYIFDRIPPSNNPAFLGAYHGCEIRYIFMNLSDDYSEFDKKVSQDISKYWTNFAKHHNPNSSDLPNWTKFTKNSKDIMHIDYPCHLEKSYKNYTTDIFMEFLKKKIEINNK